MNNGNELFNSCDIHVTVNTSVLQTLISENLNCSPYHDFESFIKIASRIASLFPRNIKEALFDFKSHGNRDGFLFLSGFPTDPDLMPTPEAHNDVKVQKKTFYSEFWLAAIAGLLGEPFGPTLMVKIAGCSAFMCRMNCPKQIYHLQKANGLFHTNLIMAQK